MDYFLKMSSTLGTSLSGMCLQLPVAATATVQKLQVFDSASHSSGFPSPNGSPLVHMRSAALSPAMLFLEDRFPVDTCRQSPHGSPSSRPSTPITQALAINVQSNDAILHPEPRHDNSIDSRKRIIDSPLKSKFYYISILINGFFNQLLATKSVLAKVDPVLF